MKKIYPNPGCRNCQGSGLSEQSHDELQSELIFCFCIEEQLPDDDNFEIIVQEDINEPV